MSACPRRSRSPLSGSFSSTRDLASSGVLFTLDTETGFRDAILINASYGLGEPIVQGSVTPDEYCVFKPTLKEGFQAILQRTIGSKEFKLVYDEGGSRAVKTVPVAPGDRTRSALDDEEILTLARWGCAIEDHYSHLRGAATPMDVEWAKDGRTGELFVVQARPETVHARADVHILEQYRLRDRGRILATGRSVGSKIATRRVRVIPHAADLRECQPGEVLVTDKTDPDWEPIMKMAAAIVTNRGGRTCHAAIVSRELGAPAIVVARLEFIINDAIGVHPMALVRYAELQGQARVDVDRRTAGYPDKEAFFVDRLAEGVATIGAAFHPKDVIVRLSDFKTNEYARLAGGGGFEPAEENPMIGFRGASRYYDARYRDGFALECRALKKVREQMGLRNVKIMVPFCRTLDEARRVVEELARNELRRGENELELYMMVEIPSNVILLPQFARHFDGFSIGSNDLTQLTLGVDRDSEIVAHIFDERDPAVHASIAQAIQHARREGRKIGLCGQAPSDYPEFARFLVECGIDSMSLNPDAVLRTTVLVREAEANATRPRDATVSAPAPT